MEHTQDFTDLRSRPAILLLITTIFVSSLGFLAANVVNIAIPRIQDDLDLSINQVQWFINSYSLVLAILILISGSLSDLLGQRKLLVTGLLLFVIGSAVCATVEDFSMLLIGRVVQGIGGSFVIPQSLAIINVNFADKVKAQAIGIWGGSTGAMTIFAPIIGGVMVDGFGWQSIFVVLILLALLNLGLVYVFIPAHERLLDKKVDWLGVGLVGGAISSLTFGLTQLANVLSRESIELNSVYTNAGLIILGVTGLVVFIRWQLSVRNISPLLDIRIFKSRTVTVANIFTLMLYASIGIIPFLLPLYLQQLVGLSATEASILELPLIIPITVLTFFTGKLADLKGARFVLTIGAIFVGMGSGLLLPLTHDLNYPLFISAISLISVGFGIFIPGLTKAALSVNRELSGAASGVNNAVSRLAGMLGVAIVSSLLVAIFTFSLNKNLDELDVGKKDALLNRSQQLLTLDIPENFNEDEANIAGDAIESAFMQAFRVAVLLVVISSFLAAAISAMSLKKSQD